MKTQCVILGLLTIKPMSGYDMKKWIEKSIGHFWNESNGQMYPTLKKLEKSGLIAIQKAQREGKKEKYLYAITPKGKKELQRWLEEREDLKSVRRDEELLKLFFGKNVSIDQSVALLKKREKRAQERLMNFQTIQQNIENDSSPHALFWKLCALNGIAHMETESQFCKTALKMLRGL